MKREPIQAYEEWDRYDTGEDCCPESDVRRLEADYAKLEKQRDELIKWIIWAEKCIYASDLSEEICRQLSNKKEQLLSRIKDGEESVPPCDGTGQFC